MQTDSENVRISGTTGSDRRAVKMTRLTYSRHQLRVASSPSNALAADLVRDQVAVMAALGTPAVRVAKAATATIPITFATIADPVQMGFVTSLNRPGGNLTGATLLAVEVGPKLLEILRGVVPSATIIALLAL